MKLEVRLEEQQAMTLHSSATRALNLAAAMPSLDRAAEVLRAHMSADRWAVGVAGHHVWLSWKTNGDFLRVAMIAEVA